MTVGVKAVAVSVSAVGMVTLLSGMAVHFRKPRSVDNDVLNVMHSEEGGAVAGRVVSVPVQAYKEAFSATLQLGQCPYRMENHHIIRCNEHFIGEQVFLGKAGMTVDVIRVETAEDITNHYMGSIGSSVGVLGLASVGVKYKVAVTTETTKKTLNMMSSYVMDKGVISLHHPIPDTPVPSSGALYLSEIELGGNEMFLVTLNFETEKQKVEVEITVTFKILFWTVSAKVNFVHNTFKSKAEVRVQFKSSFREEIDDSFDSLKSGIPKIEEVEKKYMEGPQKLRDLSNDDEKTHNMYYFASWNQSPYGANLNLALANHDIDFLTNQNTEMKAVLHRISVLKNKSWSEDIRRNMVYLNTTLTEKTTRLTNGLDVYHKLSPSERQSLREVYGADKAPFYYSRQLSSIIQE